MTEMERLQQIIDNTDNIVFFGGAGVSTESGIPDFRSVDGLYHQKYDYPPETILSHTFFMRQTGEFYRFYRDKMLVLDAEPNAAHRKLARLEACGKLKAIVTQNIDGLHQKAGSKKVLELHGSIHRNYCQKCGKSYSGEELQQKFLNGMETSLHESSPTERAHEEKRASRCTDAAKIKIPRCRCGGVIKPDVVLYEEGLDSQTMQEAIYYISNADVLIIGGTSLAVYPAAGLIDYFRGSHLVVINMAPTPRDRQADLLIQEKIGAVLGALQV